MRITRPTRNIGKLLTLMIILTIAIVIFVFNWKSDPTGENQPSPLDISSDADLLKLLAARISALEHRFVDKEQKHFLSRPVINNYNYSYVHNAAETCTKSETSILIVVRSALIHFKKREEIRNGVIGEYVRDVANKAKVLFFTGQVYTGKFYKSHQKSIMTEATTYGDIVQGDFEDVYSNNPFKSISMLRWPLIFCTGVTYIIRSDDDIMFNPTTLVSGLRRISKIMDTFIVGSQTAGDPLETAKKNGITLTREDIAELPSSILGAPQGFPAKTNRMLYEAALRVKPVWLEDIFVNSVCAKKMSIPVVSDPAFAFQNA
ncbi:hypothetical protein BsWGS_23647 [Bradybaena similaris]